MSPHAVDEARVPKPRLQGLPPLVSPHTALLVLGSFPSARSLAARQYYAHPQNQFWMILQALWPASPLPTGADSYQKRSQWLLDRGLGLWDVYASCERAGSLDRAIRAPRVNDFSTLRLPRLAAMAFNGGESFRHAKAVAAQRVAPVPATTGKADAAARASEPAAAIRFYRLPSTSPAHAAWRFERKLAAWREVVAAHGLC